MKAPTYISAALAVLLGNSIASAQTAQPVDINALSNAPNQVNNLILTTKGNRGMPESIPVASLRACASQIANVAAGTKREATGICQGRNNNLVAAFTCVSERIRPDATQKLIDRANRDAMKNMDRDTKRAVRQQQSDERKMAHQTGADRTVSCIIHQPR